VNAARNPADPALPITRIEDLLGRPGLEFLQQRLISYLPQQRWFGAKSRTIQAVHLLDSAKFPAIDAAILYLQIAYDDGSTDIYQLPLALTTRKHMGNPSAVIATFNTPTGTATVYDASADEDVRQAILALIETSGDLPAQSGSLRGHKSSAFAAARGSDPLPARTGSAEQSNTSILYGRKLILKLFRRLQPGENPDTEIGRFLTETAHFPRIAPFLGDIILESPNGAPTTVAMLQGLVENEGDGWQWTLDQLSDYYRRVAGLPSPQSIGTYASFVSPQPPPAPAREHAGPYLDAAALLGRRTAEMHLALATPAANPAFQAEPFTAEDLSADAGRIERQLLLSASALERGLPDFTGMTAHNAALALSRRDDFLSRARAIASAKPADFGERIRIHGDYHLGQILRSHDDFVILDFEGEPAKTLAERRTRQSPLKDVAGMLRSFGYAAYAALNALGERPPDEAKNLELWAVLWQNAVSTEFLRAYRTTIDATQPHLIPQPSQSQMLLDAYLLEKALYELLYELNNRRTWVRIPLAGILTLR